MKESLVFRSPEDHQQNKQKRFPNQAPDQHTMSLLKKSRTGKGESKKIKKMRATLSADQKSSASKSTSELIQRVEDRYSKVKKVIKMLREREREWEGQRGVQRERVSGASQDRCNGQIIHGEGPELLAWRNLCW